MKQCCIIPGTNIITVGQHKYHIHIQLDLVIVALPDQLPLREPTQHIHAYRPE